MLLFKGVLLHLHSAKHSPNPRACKDALFITLICICTFLSRSLGRHFVSTPNVLASRCSEYLGRRPSWRNPIKIHCGGVESILQCLGVKGYEDVLQRGRTEIKRCQCFCITAGVCCLAAGVEELVAKVEERKTWNKEKLGKGSRKRLGTSWHNSQDKYLQTIGVWYLEDKSQAFIPFQPHKKHLFISSGFPWQEGGQAEGQGGNRKP